MQLTFLGHQGWMVESHDFRLLIDPIFTSWFRNSEYSKVWVVPPRRLDLSKMGRIDAVYFTHEHEDHFHIESIDALPRATQIYLSGNMSEPAERILATMGFTRVRRVYASEKITLGSELLMTLYPPPGAPPERWVLQPLIRGRSWEDAFFNPVDCPISKRLLKELSEQKVERFGLVCMANNMQVPRGMRNPHDLRRHRLPFGANLEPSRVLNAHLALGDLPPLRHLAIVGGGFVEEASPFGMFLCPSQGRLAAVLEEYSYGRTRIFAPAPGERIDLGDPVDRLHPPAPDGFVLDCPDGDAAVRRATELAERFEEPEVFEYPPTTGRRSVTEDEVARLDELLQGFAVRLANTPLHVEMVQQGMDVSGDAPSAFRDGRLLLRLLRESADDGAIHYEYQPSRRAFVRRKPVRGDPMRRFPYGFECWAADFLELLSGRLVVYEIVKYRYRFWDPVEPVTGRHSFVATLDQMCAPEQNPDETWELYRRAWARVRG